MTNLEYFLTLSERRMAETILNLTDDLCLFCPMEREHRCREKCAAGLAEWFVLPVNMKSAVWKRRRTPEGG